MKAWDAIRGVLFWSLMILFSFALRRFEPAFGFFPLAGAVVLLVVVLMYGRMLKRKRLQQGPQ
jgi:hypothetical protein